MTVRGRPRAFDRTIALERAMAVFWEHGYEGVAIAELTKAMGINSPSLYAAFGSKEKLFREAVEHYDRTESAAAAQALISQPTARAAIAEVLRINVVNYTAPDKPRGCMIVLSATNCTERNEAVRDYLTELRRDGEKTFRERIDRGKADGDVPADVDAAALAVFYNTVLNGMSVTARDGSSRVALTHVAEGAIAAWDVLTETLTTTPNR